MALESTKFECIRIQAIEFKVVDTGKHVVLKLCSNVQRTVKRHQIILIAADSLFFRNRNIHPLIKQRNGTETARHLVFKQHKS